MKRASVMAPLAAGSLFLAAACNNNATTPNIINTNPSGVAGYLGTATAIGPPVVTGTIHTGSAPAAGSGPSVTITGPGSAVASGGNLYALHSATAFQSVFVSIGNVTPAASGFMEIDLAAAATDASVLVTFSSAVTAGSSFDLQFQIAATAGGTAGPVNVQTTTISTNFSSVPPVMVASYNPNPAPWLNGVACTFLGKNGCLWEFKILIQEFNGVQVPNGTFTETFTFGATTVTNSLLVTVPPHGFATVVRGLACGTPDISCATSDQLKGGTYTFTLTGSDVNGNPVNFSGPVLKLNASQ